MAGTYAPVVRKAIESDGTAILALIRALADYEKLRPPTAEAQQRLLIDLFGAKPRVECHLAFMDGYPAGYSIVLETYSSFLALPTLYLEDLFVLPEYRGRKVGYALFQNALEAAKLRGCGRMEWSVLDWNELAIKFYQRFGGTHKREWQLYRIELPR